ncbi:hypothetical protein PAXRUDRAFT_161356 [Paxillus rubicundulus Ve08.2h10]|uniref:Uncharacterized protein n=1 Tax=Paxillus rubicundulus Ve08.2h10 TaxID=930991 RepID=A0A0D0D6X8_9AGAM|nr:hypothetical protein PAXRUDRAFT_161356 [Paxillus rubicundulus Ve08.2h10]
MIIIFLEIITKYSEYILLLQLLGIAQLAFTQVWDELNELKNKYNNLSAKIPARTHAHALKPTSPLDNSIAQVTRNFCMFYHLWVPNNLFPVGPQMDIDPCSPSRWRTPESRTELYAMVPEELHKHMTSYEQFGFMFSGVVNIKRSNALKVIKDLATILFTSLKLNPLLFSGKAQEVKDMDVLALLKKEGKDEYTQLAPILFADPRMMTAEGLFKNRILVNIACIIMYGKGILTNKKQPGPKGRGQQMGALSITEGMIACTAIFAQFLLLHDTELAPTGAETGIPYQQDYKLYLEVLLKPENRGWSLDILDFFNQGIFSKNTTPSTMPVSVPPDIPHSWEGDIRAQLGNPVSSQHTEPEPLTTTVDTTTNTADTVISTPPPPPPSISNQRVPPTPHADIPVVTSSHTISSVTSISSRTSLVSVTAELHAGSKIFPLIVGKGFANLCQLTTRLPLPGSKRQ